MLYVTNQWDFIHIKIFCMYSDFNIDLLIVGSSILKNSFLQEEYFF